MFGIKGRDTFNRPHTTFGETIVKIANWWVKYFSYFLILFFILMASIGSYVWYQYLYDKEVNEQEKGEYIIQKSSAIIFKKEKFETIQEELKHRKEGYNASREEYKDIFYNRINAEIEDEIIVTEGKSLTGVGI